MILKTKNKVSLELLFISQKNKNMNIFEYSIKDIVEVTSEFGVNPQRGLSTKKATERLAKFGFNKLSVKEMSAWHIFFRQFKSAFIYLLLTAMLITMFLGEMADTLMVFLFLAINTCLGFFQEYRSEKTVQLLNKFALPRAKVLRNKKVEQITADLLVPGDIIILETGDKIPADVRLLEQENLMIDETVLTGESVPVFKSVERLKKIPLSYHQALNLAFSGTDVLKGRARAQVLATGRKTAFGKIAKLVSETKKISDFEKGISHFSQFILKLVGVTLVVVFVAHLLIDQNGVGVFELITFSVALTVSVIPEALPLVTTFSLARGAKRLAKKKVIVKRLSAIEDLGGIEILCTDKTGTLTKNELRAVNTYSDNAKKTIWFANLASSFELKKKIEPFDIALENGLTPKQKKCIKTIIKLDEESFDPKTRKNSALVQDKEKTFLISRGAPEAILSCCTDMGREENIKIKNWIKKEGEKGHRVLAVGYKETGSLITKGDDFCRESEKKDFTFAGIISFVDSIKPSAFSAVKQANDLGVKIIVITGDSSEVAGAVAREIGLIDSAKKVITGDQWQKASEKKREEYLEKYNVFARISPEEKFSIIENLSKRHTIGFLGEGINDAPALRIAGVSLVVDSAADIAREAADVILLKNNLEVITESIKEGRQVFANTTTYIKSTLASNFGNFFAVASASLMIDFLPMLPIQILLVNLLSDTPMISISTDNVDKSELSSPKKYEAKEIIIIAMIIGLVSMVFDFVFFGLFFRISPEVMQTNFFIGSILTELALLFSIRTKSLFTKAPRPSQSIIWLSIMTIVLTIGLPFTSFGHDVFKFVSPSMEHLLLIISLVIIYFIVSEMVKLWYYKKKATI